MSASEPGGPAMKVCPDCAERVKQAAAVCRFCGHGFDGRPAAWGESGMTASYAGTQTTSVLAIAGVVCAVFGISVGAIMLGILGQREVDGSGGRIGGRGLATAAIVIGVIELVVTAFILISVIGLFTSGPSLPSWL